MKKLFLLAALMLVFQTAFAEENISRIISHYNTATEDYTPESKTQSDTVFADLIGFEWAHKSVYALADEGIVSGRCEGVFAPGDNVKIKEFIKLAVLVGGAYGENFDCDFEKLDKNDWSYTYVASAKNAGLIDFLPYDTDFEQYITREQTAVISAKALELSGIDTHSVYDTLFADDDLINPQNKRYVYALKNMKILSGFGDGTFMPSSNLRRCDSAVIIYKVREMLKNSL